MLKRLFKRVFACCAVCVLFFSFVVPMAFAKEDSSGGSVVDAGGGVDVTLVKFDIGNIWETMEDRRNELVNLGAHFLLGLVDKDVCQFSSEGSGRHKFSKMRTTVDGKLGNYWICDYCGKSAGEVAEEQYEEYVQELPAPMVDSSGALYIRAEHDYFSVSTSSRLRRYYYCEHSNKNSDDLSDSYRLNFYHDLNAIFHSCDPIYGLQGYTFSESFKFTAPVDGYYRRLPGRTCSYTLTRSNTGAVVSDTVSYNGSSIGFYNAGDTVTGYSSYNWPNDYDFPGNIRYDMIHISFDDVYYSVEPLAGLVNVSSTSSDSDYNVGTRAGSITGNYGIITGSGDVQKVDTQTIVNEGDHSVYNPVTNTTTNFSDWTYDYSDRSYNLITSGGDMKVTYGDENVTIQEGDTVYNVYYLVESPVPTLSPTAAPTPAHVHSYIDSVIREPSCTDAGLRLYTCSCEESYTEAIQALGHDWEVRQRVSTEYSSSGELIQAGYTIYRCLRCGEEYKDTSGQGLIVPEVSPAPTGNPWPVSDQQFAVLAPDGRTALVDVVDTVKGWTSSLTSVYQGYVGLMTDVFPFLPEELVVLINWSLSALIFTGLFKRWWWSHY